MATTHITAAEAARDFAALLSRVREGEEFVIEDGVSPNVILRAEPDPKGRTISEILARIEARARETGYEPVMDADYAADMRDIISNRRPRDRSAWEEPLEHDS